MAAATGADWRMEPSPQYSRWPPTYSGTAGKIKGMAAEAMIFIASIGGFELEYSGERFGQDGYRYATMLMRTGADHEIELPVTVTPLGAVSRLEHAIGGFAEEQERYRQRLADAERRLASYRSRQGGAFAFADELAGKRRQLAEVEKALAADVEGLHGDGERQAA